MFFRIWFVLFLFLVANCGFAKEKVMAELKIHTPSWQFDPAGFWYKVVGEGLEQGIVMVNPDSELEHVQFRVVGICPDPHFNEALIWFLNGEQAVLKSCDGVFSPANIPKELEKDLLPLPEKLEETMHKAHLIKTDQREL